MAGFPRLYRLLNKTGHFKLSTPSSLLSSRTISGFGGSSWSRRRLLYAAAAAGGAASLLLLKQRLESALTVHADTSSWEVSPRPTPTPSRVMDYGLNLGFKITLYQYQTCPFCCKARAFLDYYGISYDVVEVNSVKRTEIKWSKYRKVPLLLVETPDGKTVQINDSSQIVSVLKTFIDHGMNISLDELLKYYPHFEDKGKGMFDKTTFDFPNRYFIMYFDESADTRSKATEKMRSLERKWRSWVDANFVHRISPNIYRTFGESLSAFKFFDEVGNWENIFSWFDRMIVIYIGSFVMRLVAISLKSKHELDDDVRSELYKSVKVFIKDGLKGKKFVGGDQVSLADLALYGAMTSFEGCDTFKDMMENTKIARWFNAMKTAVGSHEGQAVIKNILDKRQK